MTPLSCCVSRAAHYVLRISRAGIIASDAERAGAFPLAFCLFAVNRIAGLGGFYTVVRQIHESFATERRPSGEALDSKMERAPPRLAGETNALQGPGWRR